MLDEAIKKEKRSLDSLMREKAFQQVEEHLKAIDVDIKKVESEDIEALVAAKMKDMQSTLKGAAIGGAFILLLENLF